MLRDGRTVSNAALVDDLWGTAPPSNPTATLHSHVAALRRYLRPHGAADALVTEPGGYALRIPPDALDVARFDALAAAGAAAAERGALDEADRACTAALALFRGPPLADLRDLAFAAAAAARLDRARLQVLHRRVDVRMARGRHAELLGELHELVVAEPLDERFWCQLMLAEYRVGRHAEALETYATLCRRLDDELGLRPGPEAQALQQAILRHDASLLVADVEAPAGATSTASPRTREVVGAPPPADRLIGRDGEVEAVLRRLRTDRVVTLTGPGGIGKTRLAVAVATAAAARDDQPVVFADLASTTDAEDALVVLGDLLEADRPPHRTGLEAITAHIGTSAALVVLDNVEQIPAVGAVVAGLVHDCPALTVLVTSRLPLRIPAEVRHPLQPLAVPPPDAPDRVVAAADAVVLLLERARAANADVRGLEADLSDVARLCRLLDGVPLALELAAARTAALPVGVLVERIRAGLDLGDQRSGRPARHRTLHATLAWSHGLLGPAARRLLAHLSVFAGGAPLAAVEAVWAAPGDDRGASALDVLTSLVDAGLVRHDPVAGRPRYRVPEPVRGFARDRLRDTGQLDAVRTAHAAHFTAQARRDAPPSGFTDTRRLPHLDHDVENLRAALRWWLDSGAVGRAAELSTGLYRWWSSTGRFAEGRRWLEAVLAADDRAGRVLSAPARAELLMCEGFLAANQADFPHAQSRYAESAEVWRSAGVPAGEARCRYGQGSVALGLNRPAEAQRHYDAALALAREAGDDVLEVRVLQGLAGAAEAADEVPAAHDAYRMALDAARRSGSLADVAHGAVGLALTTLAGGDPEGAEVLAVEALEAADATGSAAVVAGVQLLAGVVAVGRGDADAAAPRFGDVLVRSVQAQRPAYVSEALEGIAAVLVLRGDLVGAARSLGTAARVLDEVGLPPEDGIHRQVFDRCAQEVRDRLPPDEVDRAMAEGAARGLADLDDDAVTGLLAAAGLTADV